MRNIRRMNCALILIKNLRSGFSLRCIRAKVYSRPSWKALFPDTAQRRSHAKTKSWFISAGIAAPAGRHLAWSVTFLFWVLPWCWSVLSPVWLLGFGYFFREIRSKEPQKCRYCHDHAVSGIGIAGTWWCQPAFRAIQWYSAGHRKYIDGRRYWNPPAFRYPFIPQTWNERVETNRESCGGLSYEFCLSDGFVGHFSVTAY